MEIIKQHIFRTLKEFNLYGDFIKNVRHGLLKKIGSI